MLLVTQQTQKTNNAAQYNATIDSDLIYLTHFYILLQHCINQKQHISQGYGISWRFGN